MKKFLAMLLVLTLSVGIFAACGKEEKDEKKDPESSVSSETSKIESEDSKEESSNEELKAAEIKGDDTGVRTGLAVITTMTKSTPADEDGDGNAQVDSIVAAVLLDDDGKILDAKLDTAQTKLKFNNEGKLVSKPEDEIKSKHELGDDYAMRPASPIGKEWNEQANAFVEYIIGKDIDEVKGIALKDGAPTDADLAASVTMDVAGYVDAFDKAVSYAQATGAQKGDKLGLGIVTTMGQSVDADEDAEGLAQAYSTYAAVTVNADGVITSTVLDASQGNINFDTKGVITSDITEPKMSKRELGDLYDMRKASPIGKEWDEQAEAFSAYVTGKKLEDVKGIAVNEEGKPDGVADLEASVTLTITDMVGALEKAYNNANTSVNTTEEASTTEESSVEEVSTESSEVVAGETESQEVTPAA